MEIASTKAGSLKAVIGDDWRHKGDLHIVEEYGVAVTRQVRPHKRQRMGRRCGHKGGGVNRVTGAPCSVGLNHRIINQHVPCLAVAGTLGGRVYNFISFSRSKPGQDLRNASVALHKGGLRAFGRIRIVKSAAVGDDARSIGRCAVESPKATRRIVGIVT